MFYINHTLIGKTCEDVRKHRDVRLVRTEKKAKKLVAKPQYLQHIVYSESFAAIQLKKTVVKLDKPRYFNFNPLKIQKNPNIFSSSDTLGCVFLISANSSCMSFIMIS